MNRHRLFQCAWGVCVVGLITLLMPSPLAQAHTLVMIDEHIAQQSKLITFYINIRNGDMLTLDPQMASDAHSIEAIEQLFLGLTDVDPVSADIVPELATGWSISDDERVWTFTIRDDVPWVIWDPAAETTRVLRMVNAYDVAYGIQRACDPRLGSLYTPIAAQIIQGCERLAMLDPMDVTDSDYDLVQVRALDDTTLEVQLRYAAGYFLNMTSLHVFRPVPQELIDEHGVAWTSPDVIATNGPFVLDRWVRGSGRVFIRNPLLPADLHGPGNVEQVVVSLVVGEDLDYFFAPAYDAAFGVTGNQAEEWLADERYAEQLTPRFQLGVWYVGFRYSNPPFDNVHVRRAFGAAIDRTKALQPFYGQHFVPMIHFTPPGIFGAPAINEIGVGYNPDYAREQLALAGYPGCEGFPSITIATFSNNAHFAYALLASLEDTLNCDTSRITVEFFEQSEIEGHDASFDFLFANAPHLWILGWKPDYPDAHNWVGDVIGCEGVNMFQRPCSAVDDLIWQAAVETDPGVRAMLYRDIEERFFGEEGEHPMIPLGMEVGYVIRKPWVDGPFTTDGLFGGIHYDWYTIDQKAQLAARGD